MILWKGIHKYVLILTLKLLLTGRRKRQEMDGILERKIGSHRYGDE